MNGKFSEIPHFILEEYLEEFYEKNQKTPIEYQQTKLVWDNGLYFEDNDAIEFSIFYNRGTPDPPAPVEPFEHFVGARLSVYTTKFLPYMKEEGLIFNPTYDPDEFRLNGGRLIGPRTGISTYGSKWSAFQFYAKDEDYGYKQVKLSPVKNTTDELTFEDNDTSFFTFDKKTYDEIELGTEIKRITEDVHFKIETYNATIKPEKYPLKNGEEVYIRSGSFFHQWFEENKSLYKKYVTTLKDFILFGNTWETSESMVTSGDPWHIRHLGMKDFSFLGLPENNRNDRLQAFFHIYFDRVYQEVYNMMKELWYLIDAEEIREDFLGYIATTYGFNLDQFSGLNVLRQRELVKNLIYWLKEKGTYSALYSIWLALSNGVKNDLQVYECWQSPSLSGVPFEHFEDHLYTDFYANDPDYPTYFSEETSGKELSTHYKLKAGLNNKPFSDTYIIDKNLISALHYGWELVRPTTRVAHYYEKIFIPSDFSNDEVSLYDIPYRANWYSKFLAKTTFVEGTFITVQNVEATTVKIKHELGSNNISLQCYSGKSLERVFPKNTYPQTTNTFVAEFEEGFSGVIFVARADHIMSELTEKNNWIIDHILNNKYVLNQVQNDDYNHFMPDEITLINNDESKADFYTAESGYAISNKGDLIYVQNTPQQEWNINHNLGYQGCMIDVYSDNEMILPDFVYLKDKENSTITFSEPVSGHAVIKQIGNMNYIAAIGDKLTDNSYWKIGDKYDINYDPTESQDLLSPTLSGSEISWIETDKYFEGAIIISKDDEYDVKELGIFSKDDELLFYSRGNQIYKIDDVYLEIHYRVYKDIISANDSSEFYDFKE